MSKLNPALVGPSSLVYSPISEGQARVLTEVAPEGDATTIAVEHTKRLRDGANCSSNFRSRHCVPSRLTEACAMRLCLSAIPATQFLAGLVYATLLVWYLY